MELHSIAYSIKFIGGFSNARKKPPEVGGGF